jgi:hypothetical protein
LAADLDTSVKSTAFKGIMDLLLEYKVEDFKYRGNGDKMFEGKGTLNDILLIHNLKNNNERQNLICLFQRRCRKNSTIPKYPISGWRKCSSFALISLQLAKQWYTINIFFKNK